MWAAGAAALAVISLVPIALALRYHQESVVTARIPALATSPVAANATAEALITSHASMINVGSSLVMDPPVVNLDTDITVSDNSAVDSPDETAKLPALVTHAFERHALSVTKPQPARPASAKSPTLTHNFLPPDGASLPVNSPMVKAPAPAMVPQTTLRIDIVSSVKDQTLAIYSGDELLLTTPLQPAHLGDTLRLTAQFRRGTCSARGALSWRQNGLYAQRKQFGTASRWHQYHGSARESALKNVGEARNLIGSRMAKQQGFVN